MAAHTLLLHDLESVIFLGSFSITSFLQRLAHSYPSVAMIIYLFVL